ncbi:acyl-CoA synthetase [Albimonas sp. CAU 1670]|uniref:acyl-CoA synthetase n=1 Tax=Albimonas sp. CAU 1670 TaxID=3032599 RepID=UPI0023DCBF3A|nr:acyl-CoA synthetase [Albimonas sp. CAU 1670]MDF2232841.1 acyl-CoA synthetase [Albimonas sp. CAU 1670]
MVSESGAFATVQDKARWEEVPLSERWSARSVYEQVSQTASKHPRRPAVSFQITSGPTDKAVTMNWAEVRAQSAQLANLLRELGVNEGDSVAYLLPNCTEAAITLVAGATAGKVCPLNPLLDAESLGGLLRELDAKVLVTLAPFPKSDVAEKASAAVALAPNVKAVLEVDLKRYLSPPLSWIVPLIRPKRAGGHKARVLDFHSEIAKRSAELTFAESGDPASIGACFHTGGTTGMPKVAQHAHEGMLYNGWCSASMLVRETDVLLCPLPMFHVFAAYPIWMACIMSGAHMVMPTPAGYRGDGVFDNFWKLVERWKATLMIVVPTAAGALMQRPVNADVSSVTYALCGSSPLPRGLFDKFEEATGVKILEGYGMTEATCLVSCNPKDGERKVGSVGLSFPYTEVRILHFDAAGNVTKDCATDEIGEICVSNPGVRPGQTYLEAARNVGLFADEKWLRTGDLGRVDADGYLWITGRAKDLIIRGGHNIDPAEIEEALAKHPAVAFVGAIGQPDAHSGEVPAAYVELAAGSNVTVEELQEWAIEHVHERAAHPRYIELMDEIPKTAVGKIFKPDLRKSAIRRIHGETLAAAGITATIQVIEDKKLGLVSVVSPAESDVTEERVKEVLSVFPQPVRVVSASPAMT